MKKDAFIQIDSEYFENCRKRQEGFEEIPGPILKQGVNLNVHIFLKMPLNLFEMVGVVDYMAKEEL